MGSKSRTDLKKVIKEFQRDKVQVPFAKLIPIHMMIDEPGARETTRGWVHTHLMWELFKLPDLEIRGVRPDFMMVDAGLIINTVGQYMVDAMTGLEGAKEVKLGQKFGLSPVQTVTFVEASPLNPEDKEETEGHYSTPRWTIVNAVVPHCAKCAAGGKHAH